MGVRKDAKTFKALSKNAIRNIQYDKVCDIWRVRQGRNFGISSNTSEFKIKKFTFRLDYGAPAIEICVPHVFTQERIVQLGVRDDDGKFKGWKTADTPEMRLAYKLLTTKATSCCLAHEADEELFKTLCQKLDLDQNRG